MLWSILIAAIPERYHTVQPLLLSLLEHQSVARMPDVELLYLLDNKRRTVGAKRNDLVAAASGEYISFIDDDDEVASNYVNKIYWTIVKARKAEPPADVICFGQRATLAPAGITHECKYSLDYWKNRAADKRRQLDPAYDEHGQVKPYELNWSGPPAHTMVWRREMIGGFRFPEKQFGEDVDWVDQCCEKAVSEVQIEGPPLYFYKFDESKTATR